MEQDSLETAVGHWDLALWNEDVCVTWRRQDVGGILGYPEASGGLFWVVSEKSNVGEVTGRQQVGGSKDGCPGSGGRNSGIS